MTPADKGRFCLNCQKTVTDFSKLSDTELIELLQSKQASTCGRFLPEQLNRVLTTSIPAQDRRRTPFMPIAAIATALTIMAPSAKAVNAPQKIQCSVDDEGKQTATLISHQDPTGSISGIVLTDTDALPLPGATIKIKNTHIGTQTDQSGNFRLRIPDNFRKKVLILEVSFIGYEKKTVKVVLKDAKPLEIRLQEDTTALGEYIIVSQCDPDNQKKLSPWEKLNSTMRNIFG